MIENNIQYDYEIIVPNPGEVKALLDTQPNELSEQQISAIIKYARSAMNLSLIHI